MFRITIVAIGSLKESYWKDAVQEYMKRLRPYAKLTFKEIKEVAFHNVHDKKRILSIEAERIEKLVPKDSILILLDREGRELPSEKLSEFLQQEGGRGEHLCFVIGGPLGVSDTVRKKSVLRLSLSRLTFTHQIVRILLLEQLYRAMTIIHQKMYHY